MTPEVYPVNYGITELLARTSSTVLWFNHILTAGVLLKWKQVSHWFVYWALKTVRYRESSAGQPFPGLLYPPPGETSPEFLPSAAVPRSPGALAQKVWGSENGTEQWQGSFMQHGGVAEVMEVYALHQNHFHKEKDRSLSEETLLRETEGPVCRLDPFSDVCCPPGAQIKDVKRKLPTLVWASDYPGMALRNYWLLR